MCEPELGNSDDLNKYMRENGLENFEVGRVSSEHRERYHVLTGEGEFEAEIIGNLRFSARDRSDFPSVGDWVAISEYDTGKVLIHAVLPRKSYLERQAAGKGSEKQIIASNIDCALIVQAVDRDFNLNRLDRYLSICNSAKISAILVLSKTDLIGEENLKRISENARLRHPDLPILGISTINGQGIEALKSKINKGMTYCLLGSSGVGKSSLSNILCNSGKMDTAEISHSTGKGKHTTSHRQLLLMDNGGLLIDNPGMREVGMTDQEGGLEETFGQIAILASKCHYADCSHTNERLCAVLEAMDRGELDEQVYISYLKLQREKEHFEATLAEKRQKDKAFGKMVREVKKISKRNPPQG